MLHHPISFYFRSESIDYITSSFTHPCCQMLQKNVLPLKSLCPSEHFEYISFLIKVLCSTLSFWGPRYFEKKYCFLWSKYLKNTTNWTQPINVESNVNLQSNLLLVLVPSFHAYVIWKLFFVFFLLKKHVVPERT